MSKSRMSSTCSPVTSRPPPLPTLHDDGALERHGRRRAAWPRRARGSGRPRRAACTRRARGSRWGGAGHRCGGGARRRRAGCRSAGRRPGRRGGPRVRGCSATTAPSTTSASIQPVTPRAPKLIGPTVERASTSTAERSDTSSKRWRPAATDGAGLAGRRCRRPVVDEVGAPAGVGRRRHRRPRRPAGGRHPALGLGQHGVGRAGRGVAAEHPVEARRAPPGRPPSTSAAPGRPRRSCRRPVASTRRPARRSTPPPGRRPRAGPGRGRRPAGRRGRRAARRAPSRAGSRGSAARR